jgi:flavin-dependent dehydrogenase
MRAARLVSGRGVGLDLALPGEAWGLSRHALDATLAAAAERAGAELRCGVVAGGAARGPAGASVTLRGPAGPEAVEARVAVVACGRQPPAGLRPAGQRPNGRWLGVKQHVTGVEAGERVGLYFFRGGYCGVAPVEGGRANVCLLADRAAFDRAGGRPEAMLAAARAWNPALAALLAAARPEPGTLRSVAAVDTRSAPVPWAGGPRLGDAATMLPPLAGDGMAMALRGAELLAPLADAYLRGRLTWSGWEAAWGTAWHAEFGRPVRWARGLEMLLAVPALADGLLGLGRLLPGLGARLVSATRPRPRPPAMATDGLPLAGGRR